jgi:hypothetical protein
MDCAKFAWIVVAAGLVAGAAANAQPANDLGEIHGLKLGLNAKTMSMDDWGDVACGSNGGPPRQMLDSWADFKTCPPDSNGLHEVAGRFDDEDEYVAKAIGDPSYAAQRTGTRVAGHPVILSALFDDDGVLRGIRFVSDPRGTPMERRMAHVLSAAVINRYGTEGWTCTDLPPAPGETPVGGVFIKQNCAKITPERVMTLETRFLRKPGENAIDPETHEYTQGQFESDTRFELYDPAVKRR